MRQLNVDDIARSGVAITFEMQPILCLESKQLFAYELLYRGPRPVDWRAVDLVLLNYIKDRLTTTPVLFINLSNETVLTQDIAAFVPEGQRGSTYFELTEAFDTSLIYQDIADRINAFTLQGIRFAIDDFGSGLDGLYRHAALSSIRFVKLDKAFLKQAASNSTTQNILKMLVAEWSKSSTEAIAEGIESSEDLEFVASLNIRLVQGFYIDRLHDKDVLAARMALSHVKFQPT